MVEGNSSTINAQRPVLPQHILDNLRVRHFLQVLSY